MGIRYSIDAELELEYTKRNIIKLLQRGKDIGVFYYQDYSLVQGCDIDTISADQAGEIILSQDPGIKSISASFRDTQFHIFLFKEENGHITLSLSEIWGAKWIRERLADEEDYITVDFQRYSRFLLHWCEEFTVLGLETDWI